MWRDCGEAFSAAATAQFMKSWHFDTTRPRPFTDDKRRHSWHAFNTTHSGILRDFAPHLLPEVDHTANNSIDNDFEA
jgi:hypothetical protein